MAAKICFISPYEELTTIIEENILTLPDPPLLIEGADNVAESAVRDVLQKGYEVFVTTAKNANFLCTRFNIPILSIPFTDFDTIYMLDKAKKKYGGPIALFDRTYSPNIKSFQEIIGCEICEFVIKDQKEAAEKLCDAKNKGFKVAVAGGLTAISARKIGLPCVTLIPSLDSIQQAYQQAREFVEKRRKEQREAVKSGYITYYAETGIIMVDTDHRISVFNSVAESILGFPAPLALGQPLQELITSGPLSIQTYKDQDRVEEMDVIGQTHVLISRIPIIDHDEFVGTVFTLRQIDKERSQGLMPNHFRGSGLTAKFTFKDITAKSSIMADVIEKARLIAATDETVLIMGETGTGKEIFAQGIHNASLRRDHAFVAVNCGAIPGSLIESELFGYAEGAFTGAKRGGRQGMFELARGGTIFLDEISELPKEAQSRLLRVLQEREFMRVGDNKVIHVNARVIGATNQLLNEIVQKGHFRSDLYYRLNILQLRIPSLKERTEDIPILIHTFLHNLCNNHAFAERIEASLLRHYHQLLKHPWQGNVRELENIVRRLLVITKSTKGRDLDDKVDAIIHEALVGVAEAPSDIPSFEDVQIKQLISYIERSLIEHESKAYDGSKLMLAKKLGICRTTLWRKLNNRR